MVSHGLPTYFRNGNYDNNRNKPHYFPLLFGKPFSSYLTSPTFRSTLLLTLLLWTVNHANLTTLTPFASPARAIDRTELPSILLSPFILPLENSSLPRVSFDVITTLLNAAVLTKLTKGEAWGGVGSANGRGALLAAMWTTLVVLRCAVGYLFSRMTGWAFPSLFFHEALHEGTYGLTPLLFAVLIVYASFLGGGKFRRTEFRTSRILPYLATMLLGALTRPIFWWSTTGLITGFVFAVALQRRRRETPSKPIYGNFRRKSPLRQIQDALPNPADVSFVVRRSVWIFGVAVACLVTSDRYHNRREFATPAMLNELSDDPFLVTFVVMTAPRRGDPPFLIETIDSYLAAFPDISVSSSATSASSRSSASASTSSSSSTTSSSSSASKSSAAAQAAAASESSISSSSPSSSKSSFSSSRSRAGKSDTGISTSNSNHTAGATAGPPHDASSNNNAATLRLYDRIQLVVYTHFAHHAIFDRARRHYATDEKARKYIRWVREGEDEDESNNDDRGKEDVRSDHRLHLATALDRVTSRYQSTYVALVEDDFPLCEGKWDEILHTVHEANIMNPDHCGVFVGTGGSGLFMKDRYAIAARSLLYAPTAMGTPPDIVLQDCLMGRTPLCSECSDRGLVTSRTLLMRHAGHNASTSAVRSYSPDEFQCGWRHPFNGNTRNVLTV